MAYHHQQYLIGGQMTHQQLLHQQIQAQQQAQAQAQAQAAAAAQAQVQAQAQAQSHHQVQHHTVQQHAQPASQAAQQDPHMQAAQLEMAGQPGQASNQLAIRRPFDPTAHDLDANFRLTRFADLKG